MRVVPDNERLELVFEEQREYERCAHIVLHLLATPTHPSQRMADGKPKLAKWSFVPKGSTIMTDPADYFAFALRELWTDSKSRRTEWCRPILKGGHGVGRIMRRQEIRGYIVETLMKAIFAESERQERKLYGADEPE